MTTQQIEYGEGLVWSFEASKNITSGVVCMFSDGKVWTATAVSHHSIGVCLVPASAGKKVSIMIEGVVRVRASAAAIVAGDLLGTFAAGKVHERTWAATNERRHDVGVALETIANNAYGKIKLLW